MSDLTGNPLIVLAADVASGPLTVWSGNIHILNIEFMNYSLDTDSVTINRSNGKSLWYENGAQDLRTVRSGHIGTVYGIVIPQGGITNGGVRIYFR